MDQQSTCVEELRRRIARLEGARHRDHACITSGCAPLDDVLPEKGFRRGSLVEWLSEGEGSGADTLGLLAARSAADDGRLVVVMDGRRDFYPPEAVRLGIEIEQLVVVHSETAIDHDWAMDQVLRSPAVAAVLAWPEKLAQRTFRRWQLAAEESGTLGLLLRSALARVEPSWADVRLLVESQAGGSERNRRGLQSATGVASYRKLQSATGAANNRRMRITLLRCRGMADGCTIDVEVDDETYRVHSVAGRQQAESELQIAK